MYIKDIIIALNEVKPNPYSSTVKLDWVNHVEGAAWNEVFKYTSIATLVKVNGIYNLPAGVSFNNIVDIYVDGDPIGKVATPSTTGYLRNSNTSIIIYPVTTDTVELVYLQPFVAHTSIEDAVLIPEPYSKVYWQYISAMVDVFNKETKNYDNSVGLYNASFKEFMDWWRDKEV